MLCTWVVYNRVVLLGLAVRVVEGDSVRQFDGVY